MPACIIMSEKEKEWTWVARGMGGSGRSWRKRNHNRMYCIKPVFSKRNSRLTHLLGYLCFA